MDNAKVKQGDQHQANDNIVIGNPLLADKSVSFSSNSSGNILFCEDGIDLRSSTISFNGNNSLRFCPIVHARAIKEYAFGYFLRGGACPAFV